jgi:hypothetical protein
MSRLDLADQRINAIVAALRIAPGEVEGRMGRRVDSLRAQEAELWTRLRAQPETSPAAGTAEIDRQLGQLETEIDIAEARLAAEGHRFGRVGRRGDGRIGGMGRTPQWARGYPASHE